MYRFGDGTPFPLDENFIETLTDAVKACTEAFMPLTELDIRRDRAKNGRIEADRELARLAELDKSVNNALLPFAAPDKKQSAATGVAAKIAGAAKTASGQARAQVESRVAALEAAALARTAADAVLAALRPFFDHHQLPKTEWIMSWDARSMGASGEPDASAVATAGRLSVSFKLALDQWRQPVRVGELADAVIVHMMKKGMFGAPKATPIDLGKYVMVAFERNASEQIVTLKERADRPSPGLRFAVTHSAATWQSITIAGDAETEANPLDADDEVGVRRLVERANNTLSELVVKRSLVELSLGGHGLGELPEPRVVPMELLHQLTPLARTIRERSRVHGELVLKRDIAGGRREELYVPRATLAQQFANLPDEYRRPFEEMGITSEDTQPAIVLNRPPARVAPPPPPLPDEVPTKVNPKT
jgi:hypothetical protein